MKSINLFIQICRDFHKFKIPKLKFKDLNNRYRILYRQIYNIEEDDVNKASFILFLIAFIISIVLSINFTNINIIIIILYSIILSYIFSYRFNLIPYNDLKKKESSINAMLYFIKIDYSFIIKTLEENSDNCINFILLIKNYKIPLSDIFSKILKKILEGAQPEKELLKLTTPSEDFDKYLKSLIINEFNYDEDFYIENSLEKQFKIYLNEIQSKISIFIFIGLFFPISLCFLILFQLINLIFLFFLIPCFSLTLNFLFKKFLRKNSYIIGILNGFSSSEKQKFDDFLIFLKIFAINLKSQISPELAFLNSISPKKKILFSLQEPIKNKINSLLSFAYPFKEIIKFLKFELKSFRYNIILDIIGKFLEQNALFTSDKILDLLKIINKHQELEERLEVIIKGEKFRTFFFIFLLPVITGVITGMFPLFILITRSMELNGNITLNVVNNPEIIKYILIILITFLLSLSITSNYFLELLKFDRKLLVIFISDVVFILAFFISFLSLITLI